MKISTGRVVDGKIVVEGTRLEEGAIVTVIAVEDDETFSVTEQERDLLLESMAEIRRGEFVSSEELFAELRRDR